MIPARYAATRFPGKLMQDLGGKSVIVRTYESTIATQLFDEVYVVTDSEIIFNEITSHGGNAIMSKKNHECGSDRIAEAIENMEVDIVVNVQGDEPFTTKDDLKKVLEVARHSTWTCCKESKEKNWRGTRFGSLDLLAPLDVNS